MLKYIRISNLRCIKEAKIEVAPITVLYGPNGSGKSTLQHGLAILREIVVNPNRPVEAFFDLGFASFGAFEQVVFDHNTRASIRLEIGVEAGPSEGSYGVHFGPEQATFGLQLRKPSDIHLLLEGFFPYPGNLRESTKAAFGELTADVQWNGIFAEVLGVREAGKAQQLARQLQACLNAPLALLRRTAFVHLKRGFSKPQYSSASWTPAMEDAVAMSLANNVRLQSGVSRYIEQTFGKEFRVTLKPETGFFTLNASDRATRLPTELVNDGFGINQVVYLLAVALGKDVSCVCIEEPEIHLHPLALRNLASVFVGCERRRARQDADHFHP